MVIIIGAGIVGLATALSLLEKNPNLKITIVEKEIGPALHQTGNNSGVIHAGVYYKPGSLKALNCRKGYNKLIEFCEKEEVQFDLCGKLIIATRDDELERLNSLFIRATQNGLDKVIKLNKEQITEYEPHATGKAGLYVPYTGIIDYTKVASKYAEIIQNRYGGKILFNSKVIKIIENSNGIEVITNDKAVEGDFVINTAGLQSDLVAKLSGSTIDSRIIPFRGEYMELIPEKEYLVKNLIYPVPDPNFPFLGVHFTRMINGGIEAGPNAVWAFAREGYKFTDMDFSNLVGDLKWKGFRKVMRNYWKMGLGEYYRSFSKSALERSMQKLIPEITTQDFKKGAAGVRAQLCHRTNGLIDDFVIMENRRIINVLNAPSPAATASLAIGEFIAEMTLKRTKQ